MYALQSLAWLSSKKRPALSKEIAEDLSISPTYLTKILQTLRLAGILKATRGKNGGFQLDKKTVQTSPPLEKSLDGLRCLRG